MDSQLHFSKAALRRTLRARLKQMDPSRRASASAAACSRMSRDELWQKAEAILFYAPLIEELDIWPLAEAALAERKVAAFPRFDADRAHYGVCRVNDLTNEMGIGKFGIREPAGACATLGWDEIDLVFVPGLAFDLKGNRLGRGMGFYDRLLAGFRGMRCGVCFAEQVVDELPVGTHDVSVQCVLTPTRLIKR